MTQQPSQTGTGSVAAVYGHPIHPFIVPVAIGMYVAATGADVAAVQSGDPFWARSASWLLLGSVGAGAVAAVPGLIDLLSIKRADRLRIGWAHAGLNALFLIVASWNYALRQPDPSISHGAFGLILSLLGLALLGASGWLGGEMTFRHGIGVSMNVGDADSK